MAWADNLDELASRVDMEMREVAIQVEGRHAVLQGELREGRFTTSSKMDTGTAAFLSTASIPDGDRKVGVVGGASTMLSDTEREHCKLRMPTWYPW